MNLKFDDKGLIPAIVQDSESREVLMLGYMNQEAFDKTNETKKVTFYSRSKQRLWTKGESSGNFLSLIDIKLDCDEDALLVQAIPNGPTCHKGTQTCWGDQQMDILDYLEETITNRKENPDQESYVASLFKKGINKIAQKVGEEAVELVIESKDENDDLFLNEAADLFFHYLILLKAKNKSFSDVKAILENRRK